MERIKDALDKARVSRQAKRVEDPIAPARLARTAVKPSNLSKVSYDKTRVVELDPDVLDENRIVSYTKTDPRSANFDILRTQVLQKMRAKDAKTLAITSPSPECGKSVIAINLAFSIAQNSTDSVLLVDFDLRRPSIAKYLGIDVEPSLFDYLSGSVPLDEVLINPGIPRVVVLPNKRPIINASETLASRQVADLIAEVRDRYKDRVVIFDLPPLLTVDDAMVMIPNVDATLLVVAAGISKTAEIKECSRFLKDSNMLGVVMNRSDAKTIEYY